MNIIPPDPGYLPALPPCSAATTVAAAPSGALRIRNGALLATPLTIAAKEESLSAACRTMVRTAGMS
jgi:hypothetical protein